MNRTHRTKDGNQLLIAQMDDGHLINTLNLICRKVKHLRDTAQGKPVSNNSVFYGYSQESAAEEARERIVESVRLMEPYAAECALRGLDVSKVMQDTLGREGPESITIQSGLDALYEDDFEYEEAYAALPIF